jgi:glycosyltransferase involved in cell wall biosynthesis
VNQPLVSIIIPIYNQSAHVDELINNIKSFTYKNIEVIIGDDCSTDDTYKVLSKYKDLPYIKIFQTSSNLGPGKMRNKLIRNAKGKYVAMQDSDDLSTPERIAEQVLYLELNKEVAIVGTGCSLFWEGNIWGTLDKPAQPSFLNWFMQNSVVHASIMLRAEVFKKASYAEELRTGEDYFFLTQAYFNREVIHNLNKLHYIYRVDPKDLKTRNQKLFSRLISAKILISRLFPAHLRFLFLAY